MRLSKSRRGHGDNTGGPVGGTENGRLFSLKGGVVQPSEKSHASRLVSLAREVEFFHTPDHEAYAIVPVGSHHETWAVKSRTFHRWLMNRFYEATSTTPNGASIQAALGVFEGKAIFHGSKVHVHTRIAERDDRLFIDLASEDWEAVEVSSAGWRILSGSPVYFRRARGMLPLPTPIRGGSVDELRPFLNLPSDPDWILAKGWLLGAMRSGGSHLILSLCGEQGSAKSTTAKALKGILDPSTVPLRAIPRDERDLMISAKNSWILAFDNLSGLPPWISDAFCRLSTGGGFGTRGLYSDDDEVLFDAKRPILLNGIDDLGTRGDMLDRAICLNLPSIPRRHRRPEKTFWTAYEETRPRVLGALLDAAVAAMGNAANVKLKALPRMADPIIWVTAGERSLGIPAGAFLEAYSQNKDAIEKLALEASPVVEPLRTLLKKGDWDGTASDLLQELARIAAPEVVRRRNWPRIPNFFTNTLRRLAPNLRSVGIRVSFHRTTDRDRRRLVSIATVRGLS